MKNSVFTLSLLSILFVVFTACQPEHLAPELSSTSQAMIATNTQADNNDGIRLAADVLSDLPVDLNDPFEIALKQESCFAGGLWAKVYDPSEMDNPEKFGSLPFIVEWRQNDQVIQEGNTLKCACGDLIEVVVTHMQTGKRKAAELNPPACKYTPVDPVNHTTEEEARSIEVVNASLPIPGPKRTVTAQQPTLSASTQQEHNAAFFQNDFVKVYPQNAIDHVFVEVEYLDSDYKILVMDRKGNDLAQAKLQEGSPDKKVRIDLHDSMPGTYYVQTTSADGRTTLNKFQKID